MTNRRNPHEIMLTALKKIAVGKTNNGMPLARDEARQVAREAMVEIGETWLGGERGVVEKSQPLAPVSRS